MPSQRRLKTQEDVRRALANVYREVEEDQMEPGKGRVLIYCALTISGVIAEHETEARFEEIERRMTEMEGKK
jgi:hypothetical protein